jgi:hypothetical protein
LFDALLSKLLYCALFDASEQTRAQTAAPSVFMALRGHNVLTYWGVKELAYPGKAALRCF